MQVILSPPIFWIFRQIQGFLGHFRSFLAILGHFRQFQAILGHFQAKFQAILGHFRQFLVILGNFRPFLGQIFRQFFFAKKANPATSHAFRMCEQKIAHILVAIILIISFFLWQILGSVLLTFSTFCNSAFTFGASIRKWYLLFSHFGVD